MSKWRVGGKVPLNVYEGDTPMFQCHTPEQATRIVALLNGGDQLRDVIHYIDSITGDDFCEDLDCRMAFHPERLSKDEITAHGKLSLIYQAAHGFDEHNTCYHVHDDWRKRTLEAAAAIASESEPAL